MRFTKYNLKHPKLLKDIPRILSIMPYYQLRITLSESRTRPIVYRALKALKQHLDLETYSCGYEELNKFGEHCDPHYHFNFYEDKLDRCNPVRCIRDWIRRHFQLQDIELKGNKQWSFQMVEEPNDFERWFRYPLKEMPELGLCNLPQADNPEDPSEFKSVQQQHHLAREERKHTIHLNLIARQKAMNKDQFKDKLFAYLDKTFTEALKDMGEDPENFIPSEGQIYCQILAYYKNVGKPMSFDTVGNYTNLYRLENEYLSHQSAYELWKKKCGDYL